MTYDSQVIGTDNILAPLKEDGKDDIVTYKCQKVTIDDINGYRWDIETIIDNPTSVHGFPMTYDFQIVGTDNIFAPLKDEDGTIDDYQWDIEISTDNPMSVHVFPITYEFQILGIDNIIVGMFDVVGTGGSLISDEYDGKYDIETQVIETGTHLL